MRKTPEFVMPGSVATTIGTLPSSGAFGWKRRMGVHEAYHQSTANRLLHWLCIPVELWAVVKLASLVPILPAYHIDLALVLIVALAPVYLLTELLAGTLMVAFLAGSWYVAGLVFPETTWAGALAVVVAFALTFGAQVAIGHGVFEEGRDDTQKNLEEFASTKNPIPLVLVFYYHLVELLLLVGYRPALRRDIQAFTDAERRTWSPT